MYHICLTKAALDYVADQPMSPGFRTDLEFIWFLRSRKNQIESEEKLSEQGREPTAKTAHFNIVRMCVLSILHHLYSLNKTITQESPKT